MSSRLPQLPNRRRGDQIGGIVLALLGGAVAVVAVVALRHPNGRQAKAVTLRTITTTPSHTAAPTPRPSGSSHSSASTTPSASPSTSASTATHPIPLIVLNNTTTTGLADLARER